jgi:hypothetical protein
MGRERDPLVGVKRSLRLPLFAGNQRPRWTVSIRGVWWYAGTSTAITNKVYER